MSSLGMDLSKILFEHEPNLLDCDLEATARAAAEISNLLGCVMATILVKAPEVYEEAFRRVLVNVQESAQKTAHNATDMQFNITTTLQ